MWLGDGTCDGFLVARGSTAAAARYVPWDYDRALAQLGLVQEDSREARADFPCEILPQMDLSHAPSCCRYIPPARSTRCRLWKNTARSRAAGWRCGASCGATRSHKGGYDPFLMDGGRTCPSKLPAEANSPLFEGMYLGK